MGFFVILEGARDDLNEVGFGGVHCGESPVNEWVTGSVDVVFDCGGANGDARDGLPLDK